MSGDVTDLEEFRRRREAEDEECGERALLEEIDRRIEERHARRMERSLDRLAGAECRVCAALEEARKDPVYMHTEALVRDIAEGVDRAIMGDLESIADDARKVVDIPERDEEE